MALREDEVAIRAGTTVEEVRRYAELGVVEPRDDGGYVPGDVLRVRLARALAGSGLAPEDLGRGIREGHLSLAFADYAMAEPIGLLGQTHRELAAEVGMSPELLDRLRVALGIPRARLDEPIREDDAEILRMAVLASGAGLSDDALVRALRVFGESLHRVVEFELEVFRSEVEQPMLVAGAGEQEMLDRMALVRAQLEQLSTRLVHLLHRRGEEHFFFQDVIEHVEAILERAGIVRPRAAGMPAIAVIDASSHEDPEAGGDGFSPSRTVRFRDLVQDLALAGGGRPETLVGDAVVLRFPDPAGAVECSLDVVERVPAAGLPVPRAGVHAGPVVVRDGEYFGRTVAVATEVAEYARPGEVLVTTEVMSAAGLEGLTYEEIGPVTLTTVSDPLTLYLLSR
jgi:adenylate cyclase